MNAFVLLTVLAVLGIGANGDCGRRQGYYDSDRIVGGYLASNGEFPWQVSLRLNSYLWGSRHICGGALISDQWILTAAHCVDGQKASNFLVGVGGISEKFPSSNLYKADRVVPHYGYNPDTVQNDIALIRLATPVTLGSKYVNSVCLPKESQEPAGIAYVSGWGAAYEDGSVQPYLKGLRVPLLPRNVCTRSYGSSLRSGMMCAGYVAGSQDACQGDSGGPLVQKFGDQFHLIGVVSWGVGCARQGFPGIYTQVSLYTKWINTMIEYYS